MFNSDIEVVETSSLSLSKGICLLSSLSTLKTIRLSPTVHHSALYVKSEVGGRRFASFRGFGEKRDVGRIFRALATARCEKSGPYTSPPASKSETDPLCR